MALENETAARIYNTIVESGSPLTAKDISHRTGIKVPTIKASLTKLKGLGLVVNGEARRSGRVGRPALTFRGTPQAVGSVLG
jgi:predicted ArsR family transcriptional regulator